MSVFWRLVLAYYICAVLFYNLTFFAWRDRRPVAAGLVQFFAYFMVGGALTWPYWNLTWPLLGLWDVHCVWCLAAFALFETVNNKMMVYRSGQQKRHALTFVVHDILALLFILLCAPTHVLYETGNALAEPWIISAVGVLVVTKMFSVFIYMVEQDLYGRDYPTIDESFITMLMRLIFFLIVLLPGWRWVLWFLVWLWACRVARRNRLLDFSRFALYFGAFGATAVGFLAKWSFYLQ